MSIDWNKFRQIAKALVRAERDEEASTINVSETINVCTEIKCPCAYRASLQSSSGCSKYSDAHQCHLLRGRPNLQKEATEYFIHSNTNSVNIAELKLQNDSFFLHSMENRESLEIRVKLGEKILYSPFGKETFDLAAYLDN